MAHKYKIIDPNKENPYLSVIEKSGVKVEFSISELWDNIKSLKNKVIEIESKVGIEKATMQNIIQNYPDLIQLFMGQITIEQFGNKTSLQYQITEKDRLAIDMFERSRRFVNGADDKLAEFAMAIREEERSLKEACDACKIPIPVETKIEKAQSKEEQVEKIINSEVKE